MIINLMDENRESALLKMLGGESVYTYINQRISLKELSQNPEDGAFYSLLIQAGYLALDKLNPSDQGLLKIPNKELMHVWRTFILSYMVKSSTRIISLFENISNLPIYDEDVKYFLNDRLSYFDISVDADEGRTAERIYHVFMLGLLSAHEDSSYKKPPLSNRESGDGRYDILFEMKGFSIIFEFKSVGDASQMESAVGQGLSQIDEKRYYADAPKGKPLIKTAIAFCGKRCAVKSSRHEW